MQLLTETHYSSLLEDLKAITIQTRFDAFQATPTTLTKTYWILGQRLVRDRLFQDTENQQLKSTLSRISKDLNIEYSQLTRVIKFYQQFPKQCPIDQFPQLQWSHFRTLLATEPETKRLFYLEQAQHHNWSSQGLRNRMKDEFFEKTKEGIHSQAPSVLEKFVLKSPQALHIYSGTIKKIIDSNTLLMHLDLGFNVWTDVRVRLRGVHATELSSIKLHDIEAATAAKLFIQARLALVKTVVVQTFKTDNQNRYIADIYYLPGEDSNTEKIFKEGAWLNQELVEQGLAKIVS